MRYNLFRPFVIIVASINFTIDLIQRQRFREERISYNHGGTVRADKWRTSLQPASDLLQLNPQKSEEALRATKLEASLLDRINQMLRYNRLGIIQLFLILAHILILVELFLETMLIVLLPDNNQAVSLDQQEISIFRYIKSRYLVDEFGFLSKSKRYNRSMAFVYLQFLCLKLHSFYANCKNSQTNRIVYKKLNLVQIDLAFLDELSSDTSGWLGLAKVSIRAFNWRPQADLSRSMRLHRTKLGSELNPFDRLYYRNMLDFQPYYQDMKSVLRSPNVDPKHSRLRHLPGPRYRCHPVHLSWLFLAYLSCVIAMAFTLAICILSMLYGHLQSYLHLTWFQLYTELISEKHRNILLCATKTPIVLALMALNTVDNGLLLASSIIFYSRCTAVNEMLKYQINIHQRHMREFCLLSDSKHIKFSRCRRTSFDDEQVTYLRTPISNRYMDNKLEDQYELLIETYRCQLNVKSLARQNLELACLVDLIVLLKRELDDLKSFYTFRLNINMLLGTLGASISVALFRAANQLHEIGISMGFVVINAVPLLCSLLAGAFVEGSMRKIVISLDRLTANELQLIEPLVIQHMLGTLAHLSKIQNRAFVLFDSFALNFATLFTTLGWIASGYSLLHQQGYFS